MMLEKVNQRETEVKTEKRRQEGKRREGRNFIQQNYEGNKAR